MVDQSSGRSELPDQYAEKVFSFIGRYVIFFQFIESQLDQIILQAEGYNNWSKTQAKIANMRNAKKISYIKSVIWEVHVYRTGKLDNEIKMRLMKIIANINKERVRRNSLLHSHYLWDFLAIGVPAVRSDRVKAHDSVDFQREMLTTEFMESLIEEIASLAVDASFLKVQLASIYKYSNVNE